MYRARSALRHGQMSEAFSTMVFLTLSGGLQDAYTYCVRGQVFANAQTGNIVLMSQRAFAGDLAGVLRYLIPLLAFGAGRLCCGDGPPPLPGDFPAPLAADGGAG